MKEGASPHSLAAPLAKVQTARTSIDVINDALAAYSKSVLDREAEHERTDPSVVEVFNKLVLREMRTSRSRANLHLASQFLKINGMFDDQNVVTPARYERREIRVAGKSGSYLSESQGEGRCCAYPVLSDLQSILDTTFHEDRIKALLMITSLRLATELQDAKCEGKFAGESATGAIAFVHQNKFYMVGIGCIGACLMHNGDQSQQLNASSLTFRDGVNRFECKLGDGYDSLPLPSISVGNIPEGQPGHWSLILFTAGKAMDHPYPSTHAHRLIRDSFTIKHITREIGDMILKHYIYCPNQSSPELSDRCDAGAVVIREEGVLGQLFVSGGKGHELAVHASQRLPAILADVAEEVRALECPAMMPSPKPSVAPDASALYRCEQLKAEKKVRAIAKREAEAETASEAKAESAPVLLPRAMRIPPATKVQLNKPNVSSESGCVIL